MNVICPKCQETYSIKIELFLNKEQQLKCISCGHKWKENFSKEAIKNEESFQNLLSIKADRKLIKPCTKPMKNLIENIYKLTKNKKTYKNL